MPQRSKRAAFLAKIELLFYTLYIPTYRIKTLAFSRSVPEGQKLFDEVRTATEGSPSGRPKEVPATVGSTFRYGYEGGKKNNKKCTKFFNLIKGIYNLKLIIFI
ncbi:hypothetical protein [uncultured Brachyspira sp.]|uniref:hypothetical protein n=1 Tax=uncultured Brachyspira sp. TaxID=221953 RepID=UPI0025CF5744|nr:hypothetical protein [uncultured Brachyspira sp.]